MQNNHDTNEDVHGITAVALRWNGKGPEYGIRGDVRTVRGRSFPQGRSFRQLS